MWSLLGVGLQSNQSIVDLFKEQLSSYLAPLTKRSWLTMSHNPTSRHLSVTLQTYIIAMIGTWNMSTTIRFGLPKMPSSSTQVTLFQSKFIRFHVGLQWIRTAAGRKNLQDSLKFNNRSDLRMDIF